MSITACGEMNKFPSQLDGLLLFGTTFNGSDDEHGDSSEDRVKAERTSAEYYGRPWVDPEVGYVTDGDFAEMADAEPRVWSWSSEAELDRFVAKIQHRVSQAIWSEYGDNFEPSVELVLDCIEGDMELEDIILAARGEYRAEVALSVPRELVCTQEGDEAIPVSFVGSSSKRVSVTKMEKFEAEYNYKTDKERGRETLHRQNRGKNRDKTTIRRDVRVRADMIPVAEEFGIVMSWKFRCLVTEVRPSR